MKRMVDMATLPPPDPPLYICDGGTPYIHINMLNQYRVFTETPPYPFCSHTPRGVYKKLTIYFLDPATYYSTN